VEVLKKVISQEVAAIPLEIIRENIENYRKNLNQFIKNKNRKLSDIIFKNSFNKMA
jgi:hypothetical protein